MSEKRKPTYVLGEVKGLVSKEKTCFSRNSRLGAHAIGLSDTEIKKTMLSLESSDFCKSKTDYYNNKIWYDIYRCVKENNKIYIKFKIAKSGADDICVITSFKQDEEGNDV